MLCFMRATLNPHNETDLGSPGKTTWGSGMGTEKSWVTVSPSKGFIHHGAPHPCLNWVWKLLNHLCKAFEPLNDTSTPCFCLILIAFLAWRFPAAFGMIELFSVGFSHPASANLLAVGFYSTATIYCLDLLLEFLKGYFIACHYHSQ